MAFSLRERVSWNWGGPQASEEQPQGRIAVQVWGCPSARHIFKTLWPSPKRLLPEIWGLYQAISRALQRGEQKGRYATFLWQERECAHATQMTHMRSLSFTVFVVPTSMLVTSLVRHLLVTENPPPLQILNMHSLRIFRGCLEEITFQGKMTSKS